MAFRIPRIVIKAPGVEVTLEPDDSEREALNELFVVMSDKRAILDYYVRADQEVVTASIRHLRHTLGDTILKLKPDAASRAWLEQIRAGIREYLTAVETAPHEPDHVLFAPALRDLRMAVREVAVRVALPPYKLPIAGELVAAMDKADAQADPETKRLYEDPIPAYKALLNH
jgi:hypothetical protein